jgi:hypothetical protein
VVISSKEVIWGTRVRSWEETYVPHYALLYFFSFVVDSWINILLSAWSISPGPPVPGPARGQAGPCSGSYATLPHGHGLSQLPKPGLIPSLRPGRHDSHGDFRLQRLKDQGLPSCDHGRVSLPLWTSDSSSVKWEW